MELGRNFHNGAIIKYPKQGNINLEKIGDLKIKINIISDENYEVKENYVEKKMVLPFRDFILGSKIYFTHPRGKGEFEIFESTPPGFKKLFNNLVIQKCFLFKYLLVIN